MKVIFLNRGLHSHFGGDLVQVEQTAWALRRHGVNVVVESEDPHWHRPRIDGADIVHIVHCNFTFSMANFKWAEGLPVVLTPLFYDSEAFGVTFQQVKELMESAVAVVPFTKAEGEIITRTTGFSNFTTFIPNGTDKRFHATDDPVRREGVLAVTSREGTKGTGIVKELCEELGYPFIIGTGLRTWEMPELYKRHRVFVHAADREVMSLIIGEALCANCRVLATDTNPGNEWYPGLVKFSPHMPEGRTSLKWLLTAAYEVKDWNYIPNEAARNITWDSVALKLIEIYKGLLK